jgi:hypothetical protein
MPKATTEDLSHTKNYIPKFSQLPTTSPSIGRMYLEIENRNIHEGRVVDLAFAQSDFIDRLFSSIKLNCLYEINEPIVPRFIVDFYSQVTVQTNDLGFITISFMIQNEFITLTLEQFGQILQIPFRGHAVFSNEWDLETLHRYRPTFGPYLSDIPHPDEIRQVLGVEHATTTRKIKSKNVQISPYQLLLKELSPHMKRWEELIRENAFGTGGHRDHLPACLAHMLYCIAVEKPYNLAYFFFKQIECARKTPKANLPYGMFLTRLYRHVIEYYPDLDNSIYESIYPTLRPLALKQARRTRNDKGKSRRHSFHGSSSRQDDDDEEENIHDVSTPSFSEFVDNLEDLDYSEYSTPSPSAQTEEVLHERTTEMLRRQKSLHEEVRGGFKSIGKTLKGIFRKKKR